MNNLTLTKIFSGDTLEKTATLSEYPSSEWVLSYEIGTLVLTFNSSHILSSIVNLDSGVYQYRLLATNIATPTLKKTLLNGQVTIIDLEYRSHARKVLEAIEANIEGRASQSQSEMTINGRSIKYYSPEQLIKLRQTYQREVANEIAQDRLNAGLGSKNKILVRF